MSDPTLAHDFKVGDRVRGKPDAGPSDRYILGTVVEVGPHVEGHARDVIVEGRYADTGEYCYVACDGTEIEHWSWT